MPPRTRLEPEQVRTGVSVGDIPTVVDVGGVPGLPALDGSLLTNVGAGGTGAGAAVNPGELMHGTRLSYYKQGGAPAGEVQYIRLRLGAGTVVGGMQAFVVSAAAGGSKRLRMGLYNQSDPANPALGPYTKVRETAQVDVAGTSNTLYYAAFTAGNYTVPSTGYYWLAIVQDSTSITFAISEVNHAGFVQMRRETPGATADLPSSAGTLTNPASPAVYVAGVQVF